MGSLLKQVYSLRKDPAVAGKIRIRLSEFRSFKNRPSKDWFSELCFCLMTANWKAREAMAIQQELCKGGFCDYSRDKLAEVLKKRGHRFWPQRADRICLARDHLDIKEKITKIVSDSGQVSARDWLADNIVGLGYKEASHFLRNVGYLDLAILDRHILGLMAGSGMIEEKPKSLTKKKYLQYEYILKGLADSLGMSQGELDLFLFYIKTGEVLK